MLRNTLMHDEVREVWFQNNPATTSPPAGQQIVESRRKAQLLEYVYFYRTTMDTSVKQISTEERVDLNEIGFLVEWPIGERELPEEWRTHRWKGTVDTFSAVTVHWQDTLQGGELLLQKVITTNGLRNFQWDENTYCLRWVKMPLFCIYFSINTKYVITTAFSPTSSSWYFKRPLNMPLK